MTFVMNIIGMANVISFFLYFLFLFLFLVVVGVRLRFWGGVLIFNDGCSQKFGLLYGLHFSNYCYIHCWRLYS
jgi:hypothetical protein